jgi:hypothetical protein
MSNWTVEDIKTLLASVQIALRDEIVEIKLGGVVVEIRPTLSFEVIDIAPDTEFTWQFADGSSIQYSDNTEVTYV